VVSPVAPPPNTLPPAPVVSRPRHRAGLVRGFSPQQAYLWGLGLGSFALGLVNGALVISTGIGVLAYRQLAQLSPAQQQALRQRLQSAVPLPRTLGQQALVLSLMLGASTYTVTALWQSTHSLLMALVLTGQTALTFFVVVALLRSPADKTADPHPTKRADGRSTPNGVATTPPPTAQTLEVAAQPATAPASQPPITEAERFEQALAHLTQADPLQRLIAVRQLVRLVNQAPSDAYIAASEVSIQTHLIDCFHLMLAHEPEPIVRSAVREGLALLRQPPPQDRQLPAGAKPLPDLAPSPELAALEPNPWFAPAADSPAPASPPSVAATSPAYPPSPRRTVEYVEYLDI